MATIGLRYPRYCVVTVQQNPDGTETEILGEGKVMGKIISANETINFDTQYQYGDDGVAETISYFTDGTLSIQVADLIQGVKADLLGRTISPNGEMVANENDLAPYVRVGYIIPCLVNGQKKWRACVYPRMKFAPTGRELQTRGQNITLAGETITGSILRDKNGDWQIEVEVDTLTEAVEWLANKTNMPTGPAPALTMTSSPEDGDTGVSVDASVVLTFSNPLNSASVAILNATTGVAIPVTLTYNGAKTVLTAKPTSALATGTQYMVVVSGVRDAYAQKLADTTLRFTTA